MSGPQHTDVTVKPGAMTVTATNGGGTAEVAADPSVLLEIIGDNLIATSVMIPAVLHATGAKAFTLAVLSGGKAVVCNVVTDPLPSRPASVPASDANLALDLGGIRESYWKPPCDVRRARRHDPVAVGGDPSHVDRGARLGSTGRARGAAQRAAHARAAFHEPRRALHVRLSGRRSRAR